MKKDICGKCEKGVLQKKQVEFRAGFFVDARVCPECGEQWFDLKTVQQIGARASQRERTLIKLGNSLAITLPQELTAKYRLKAGGKVHVIEEENQFCLRPAPA